MIEDPERYGYYRPEGDGMLVGLFEPVGAPWSLDGVSDSFAFGTLPVLGVVESPWRFGGSSAKHAPAVTAAVKTIFAHTDPEEVADQWDRAADTLAGSFPNVAAMMGEAKTDVLAFTAFPNGHWHKIWSNSPSGSTRRSSAALMS